MAEAAVRGAGRQSFGEERDAKRFPTPKKDKEEGRNNSTEKGR